MAKHKSFTTATDVKVYFCDPQSPWQRGSNENTNGLLRQYFPRRTDLSGYTQAHLDKVALRLNQRPRKTLGFQTPASRLQESVASTGGAGTDYRTNGGLLLHLCGSRVNQAASVNRLAGPNL
jgi:IS30 family transposase